MKTKFTALLLALILIISVVPVSAAAPPNNTAEPTASYLISSYRGWVSDEGSGNLRVVCDLSTKYIVDTMGAPIIEIQRFNSTTNSWEYVGTIVGNIYNRLLRNNTGSLFQGVTYGGLTSGRTYRAVIKFYAKTSTVEEARYYTTSSVTLS